MKLQDILDDMATDLPITNDYALESTKTSNLFIKYQKIYSAENLLLKQQKSLLKKLRGDLIDFYRGKDHTETDGPFQQEYFTKYGKYWERAMPDATSAAEKAETDFRYLELDLKVNLQAEKVRLLEEIIKHINGRTWQIGRSIDWKKFENGMT